MESESRDLLTVEQAAQYLQLSQSSIRSYIRQGKLNAFRIAGKRNVAQLLDDLSHSRRLGFFDKGQPVIDYDLAGMTSAVAQLKDCAARAAGRPA